MTRLRFTAIVFVLGLTLVPIVAASRQQAEPGVLLRAAIEKEEVTGDLNAAIEQYKRVIEVAGTNRAVAAQALLRLGGCYEKLGQAEARKVYERLVAEYADQTREAKAAGVRLAALPRSSGSSSPKLALRQVRMPSTLASPASLSPDGQRLAFISDGSVWVVPVKGPTEPDLTGTPVRLTETPQAQSEVAWSGDGRWLAFNAPDGIYMIQSSGGTARKLPLNVARHGGQVVQFRLSLSHDGSMLAYSTANVPIEESFVYIASTRDGAPRRISQQGGSTPAISPDGKLVAYATFDPWVDVKQGPQGKLWVAGSEGGDPVLLSDAKGCPNGPIWSPDGTTIAFVQSTKPGDKIVPDLRIVRVSADGRPVGEPRRFELPFPHVQMAAWTSDGEIGLCAWKQEQEAIYTVPATGGRAAQLTPKDWASHPRWSPDGNRIFLRWGGGNIGWVPAQGGQVTVVPINRDAMKLEAVPGGGNAVSPDGKTLVFTGASPIDDKWTTNIWTVPAEGGQPTQITSFAGADTRFPCWSPDGKQVAFVARDNPLEEPKPGTMLAFQIYSVSSAGGEARKLTTGAHDVAWAGPAWSPDGKQIAYFTVDKRLNVMPAAGGEPRLVVALGKPDSKTPPSPGDMCQLEMAWSPDGTRLAYAFGGRLWIVSAQGGTPAEVATGLSGVVPTKLDWSPDGKTIAFTGNEGGDYELWFAKVPPIRSGPPAPQT